MISSLIVNMHLFKRKNGDLPVQESRCHLLYG